MRFSCTGAIFMYADFFGLRELPFNNTPDPRFFYSTPDHEEAMASLIYAVQERKGFVLLTGEIGAGKTLVSRMMLRHFGTRIAFAAINHAVQDAADLMESVCAEFEVRCPTGASNAQLVRSLQDFLLGQFAHDTPVVLVLDEAQNLTIDAFEQLRMVGNLEADDAKLLQIIIVGQPELQRTFASRELRQLRQRVFRSFHLPALSQTSTTEYIQHRITVAGGNPEEVMTLEAMNRVFELASGLPRLINTICDNALLSAYSANQRPVGRELIDAAAEQTPELGVAPTEAPLQPTTAIDNAVAPAQEPAPCVPVAPDTFRPTRDPVAAPPAQAPSAARRGLTNDRARREAAQTPRAAKPPVPRRAASPATSGRPRDVEKSDLAAIHTITRQARSAEQTLRPLVSQALDTTQRAQAALQDLRHRETQGRQLAVKLKTLLDNTRRILEGLKWTAGRIRRGEQSALDTLKRLESRTKRAQQLADDVGNVFSGILHTGHPVVKPGIVSSVVSKPVSGLLSTPRGPKHLPPAETMNGALDSTRRSLSDLRTLVRDGAGENSPHAAADEPISGIEREVENLAELIGSD